MRRIFGWLAGVCVAAATLATACDDKPAGSLAPVSSSLVAAKPASQKTTAFDVDTGKSNVEFLMQAPVENIHGKAPASVKGQLFVDLEDITKSTGLLRIDLEKLVVYQAKRKKEKGDLSPEDKSDKQNEDMKTWFEISDDAPAAAREKNRWVEFKLDKVDQASQKDVLGMSGAERKITATVSGDFLLHGRKVKKTAEIEITFKFDGDKPKSITLKTTKPVEVGLEEHDVKPRKAFEVLAAKTLSDLGQKVAQQAPVTFEITAKAK